MESTTYRIRASLFGEVFEADGPAELVREDHRAWREDVMRSRTARPSTVPPPPPPLKGEAKVPPPEQNGDLLSLVMPPHGPASIPTVEPWHKIFKDEGTYVSLNVLPRGENAEADTLTLLLLGMSAIKGQEYVFAPTLMNAAKKSGLTIDRVDRTIATYERYVQFAGQRRGKRYSLNNPGQEYARSLAASLIQ